MALLTGLSGVFFTVVGVIAAALFVLMQVAKRNRKVEEWLTVLLLNYRWVLVIPVVLPLSALFDVFWFLRYHLVIRSRSAPHKHPERVQSIVDQVKRWNETGRQGKLCTARPNWLNISPRTARHKESCNRIKVDLTDILDVNLEQEYVVVEPLVDVGLLTRYLTPLGYTIPVIPEFEDLTVGGLICGYGIENTSHKYGLFKDLVQELEVVLANGEVVRCSPKKNADLFYGIPWSHGTLGFVTEVKLKIIKCKKWCHLTYIPTYTLKETVEVFTREACRENPHEFVEVLMYDRNHGVVMIGDMTDEAESAKINRVGWWFKPWYYKWVESMLDRHKPYDEFIPLREYYHRYTRAIFWNMELIIPFGNQPWFRYLFGWMLPPKVSFLKLTQTELIKKYYQEQSVIQDLLVPISRLEATIDLFDKVFKCYPLWLCPFVLHKTEPQGLLRAPANGADKEMYVDVGAWYIPQIKPFNVREATRAMEKFGRENRGYQCLYAYTFMTREEYEQMFDTTLYYANRKKYHAEGAFPHVHDKVKIDQ